VRTSQPPALLPLLLLLLLLLLLQCCINGITCRINGGGDVCFYAHEQ
jgi:hypothetical protein